MPKKSIKIPVIIVNPIDELVVKVEPDKGNDAEVDIINGKSSTGEVNQNCTSLMIRAINTPLSPREISSLSTSTSLDTLSEWTDKRAKSVNRTLSYDMFLRIINRFTPTPTRAISSTMIVLINDDEEIIENTPTNLSMIVTPTSVTPIQSNAHSKEFSAQFFIEEGDFSNALQMLLKGDRLPIDKVNALQLNAFCEFCFSTNEPELHKTIANIVFEKPLQFWGFVEYLECRYMNNDALINLVFEYPDLVPYLRSDEVAFLIDRAVSFGNFELFELLALKDAPVCGKRGEQTPLMKALLFGNFEFLQNVILDERLHQKLKIRTKDKDGYQLHQYAALFIQNEMVNNIVNISPNKLNAIEIEGLKKLALILLKQCKVEQDTTLFSLLLMYVNPYLSIKPEPGTFSIYMFFLMTDFGDFLLKIVQNSFINQIQWFDTKDANGFNLHDYAILFERPDIARALTAVNTEYALSRPEYMYTHLAAQLMVHYIHVNDKLIFLKIAKLKLANVFDIRIPGQEYAPDQDLRNILMFALCLGKPKFVIAVFNDAELSLNANFAVTDQSCNNILHYAYALDCYQVIKPLLEVAPQLEYHVNLGGKTPSSMRKVNGYCDLWLEKLPSNSPLLPKCGLIKLFDPLKSPREKKALSPTLLFTHHSSNKRDPDSPRKLLDEQFRQRTRMLVELVHKDLIQIRELPELDRTLVQKTRNGMLDLKQLQDAHLFKSKKEEYRIKKQDDRSANLNKCKKA